jgi:uncharacterized protein
MDASLIATQFPARHSPQTRIFVVKVASRCNIACSYCYMYMHPDQSWQSQPRFMSKETISTLASRLEEHAKHLGGGPLMVVAHGGEPLLHPNLDYFFSELRGRVKSCGLAFSIQTNGTLLTDNNIDLLERHEVRVGVSIDGSRESHDKRRVDHRGNGTYDTVMRGLSRALVRIPQFVDSILQVIDPSVPAKEMLKSLEGYNVGRADLLFPDLNHDSFAESGIEQGEIGRWLIQVFDEWVLHRETLHLRIFVTIIRLLLGGKYGTDQLGERAFGALVVETDGSYQVYDGLKTAFHGAGFTGMDVHGSSISSVESLPLARAFRDKASGAAAQCLDCRLFPVCGGGSPIHRYSNERGFDLPSVYCEDLTMLIMHIRSYILKSRPGSLLVA